MDNYHQMPAKDIYHDIVRTALEKDCWTITNDPLVIRWGKRDLYNEYFYFYPFERGGLKPFFCQVLLENKRLKLLVFHAIQEVILKWIT
ncbi:XisH protein [Aphanothece sacrum FPU1]|uniref:XisH protein n=1 Tax=Aphanothece sacrum FPU1 TaxID=1920663 RepID=A0A401IED4_APHSA|nr:element excision factor XisH family protein [Aphanothece sacrum]GBF79637.1 XisH protein [Aphanothece sacrum FPU1]GBF87097.1 XisH protein [Aphanothece sacrum FPU3]